MRSTKCHFSLLLFCNISLCNCIRNEKSAQREANTARCLCRQGTSSISVPNLKRIAQFLQKLRGPEIRKVGHVIRPRPLRGRFMVPTQGGSVLSACTKFEADSSIVQKLLGVPNFAPPQTPFPGRGTAII